jgi:hypothetical protein
MMKEEESSMKQKIHSKRSPAIYILPAVYLIAFLAACATTTQTRSVKPAGFLKDYSQLKKGKGDQALLVYINPSADFSRYDKLLIDPVTLWRRPKSEPSPIPAEDLQRLVDYLDASIRNKLKDDYRIVERPGPGVLRMRCAITEARQSEPFGDTISNILPPAVALNLIKKVATGTSAFVGRAAIEAELLDSLTNERLAAAVDERAGTKTFEGKLVKCDDVYKSFDYWADKLKTKLAEFRAR